MAAMTPEPHLTRRPDPHHKDAWLVYADDICAGSISRAVGLPNAAEAWKFSAGLYPGSRRSRAARPIAWRAFASTRTEADFEAWRERRDWTARKHAARDRGEEVPLR
jgi:hypothetical protein